MKKQKRNKRIFLLGVKVGTLQRMLRKVFGHRWWKRNNKEEKLLIADLKWMPEVVIDYLLEVELSTFDKFIYDINIWLEMETAMDGKERRRYKAGWGKVVFENEAKAKKN